MDANSITALAKGGETLEVEFKSDHKSPISDKTLAEMAVCLANAKGGTLLVGVEDDGTITGARPRHGGFTDPARLEAVIANNTLPPLAVTAEVVEVAGSTVIAVTVPRSPRVVGTASGLYVKRTLSGSGAPMCAPYHAYEMFAHEIDRGAVDYAALSLARLDWDDLDPLEFERFRKIVRASGARGDGLLAELADREILRALGLANEKPRVGALLLFGREDSLRHLVPTHEAGFQVLDPDGEVRFNQYTHAPLLRVFEEFSLIFQARNDEEEIMLGPQRIGVPAFAEAAFREALANALLHRDYTRLGAVTVQLNADGLTVSSPGGFPPGVEIPNLLRVPPHPRSPLLADAFKRTGLVERAGRGVLIMYESQLRIGRQTPDFSRSTEVSVTVTFPGGPANLEAARTVAEHVRRGERLGIAEMTALTRDPQVVIADHLRVHGSITRAEAAKLLGIGVDAARRILQRMVETGALELHGTRRAARYTLG